jgi:BMFP domain-containing protein YqiC
MPMFKSIQDKTFTPETFKSMFNAPLFKDIMDKVFNLQPEFLKNMSEEAKNNMFKMMDANKAAFDNMKSSFTAGMPDASDITNKMFAAYNDAVSQISNAAAPMMKLMTPGADKQNLEMMQEMSTLFSNFSQKNTQLRYMMYVTGTKAMEEVAQNVYNKVRNGDDMSSFANIYQEWLNINDKNFVSLFESEDYSKMMSEVNSMGMKLKRQIDLQMEKAMSNLPIINRSEMDELYKTIHELKKRINMLEKQIDNDAVETASAAEQKPAKKSAKHN